MISTRRSVTQTILTHIVPLFLLGALLAILLCMGTGERVSSLQSPVSPVLPSGAPGEYPGVLSGTSPLAPGDRSPTLPPLRLFSRLLRWDVWSSPWPWLAVGLVLFGGMAWALIVLFRRLEPGHDPSSRLPVPSAPSPASTVVSGVSSVPEASPESEGASEIEIDIAQVQ
jgi:hypothetical protein